MNCETCIANMAKAAASAEAMSPRRLAEFEAHLAICNQCRREFSRARALLAAIDHGVSAQGASEPSPQFLQRVRMRIAAERAENPSFAWPGKRAILISMASAAVLALAAIWLSMRPRDVRRPEAVNVAAPLHAPANPGGESNRAVYNNKESKVATKKFVASAHRPELRKSRPQRQAQEIPVVIVQPGQMRAILQLEAALQRGQVEGSQVEAALQTEIRPLKIEPMVIPPLESPGTSNQPESGPSGDASSQQSVGSEVTRGKVE